MSSPSQYNFVKDDDEDSVLEEFPKPSLKRARPSTHDVALVGNHTPNIASVAKRLQEAVDARLSTNSQGPYRAVHVLLLSWENDDLNVSAEIKELEKIFSQAFHYQVETWKIPLLQPVTNLMVKIIELGQHDWADSLLIVYYAGHAAECSQPSEPSLWMSTVNNPATISSSFVQSALAERKSDVLLLYDCCHAAPTTINYPGGGVKVFLAACGFEGSVPGVGPDSFTHALIQELGRASYSSISVAALYGRLIDRLRTWKPCISKDKSGKIRVDQNGKPLFEKAKRRTPIHGLVTEDSKKRSIVLAPLVGTDLDSDDPLSEVRLKKAKHMESNTKCYSNSSKGSPQVLLSIRVENENFDVDEWSQWIAKVPPEATGITIEGSYGGLSTLILIRMPIDLWSLLPDDYPYSFVGFVTTKNIVHQLHELTAKSPDPTAVAKTSSSPLKTSENTKKPSQSEKVQRSTTNTTEMGENTVPFWSKQPLSPRR